MFDPRTRPRHRRRRHPHPESNSNSSWFLITLTLISWIIFLFIFFSVDPSLLQDFILPESYLVFFASFSITLFLSLFLIFRHFRRSVLTTLFFTSVLFYRLHGLASALNLFLSFALVVVLDLYFSSLNPSPPDSIPTPSSHSKPSSPPQTDQSKL